MNRTLKTALAKLCQDTQLPWVNMLPLQFSSIQSLSHVGPSGTP